MRAPLALLVLVVLAGAPASANAGDGWRHVSDDATLVTDGEAWAVALRGTVLTARPDAAPTAVRTIDLAPVCAEAYYAPVTGGGAVVVLCRSGPSAFPVRFVRADLATGAVAALPGDVTPDMTAWDLGTRWLDIIVSHSKGTYHVFRDLGTGMDTTVNGFRYAPNLDAEHVTRPLCAPLRRPADTYVEDEDPTPAQEGVQRDGEWLVFARPRRPRENGTYRRVDAAAWRCGQPRPIAVGPSCPFETRNCPHPRAGAGVVTVRRGSRIFVTRLARPRERRVVRTPVIRGQHRRAFVQHTASRLWATVPGHGTFTRALP